jgi:4-hydroxy-2-oxoglutarate aldolase
MPMDHRERLSGVFPPCMTIFDENEEVDYAGIARNVERYNETKLKGYMPLGSNGEFRSLTDEESVKIVEVHACKRSGFPAVDQPFSGGSESH